jgi:hypothetical protein
MRLGILTVALGLAAFAGTECGSSSSDSSSDASPSDASTPSCGQACCAYVVPASTDLTSATSFQNDVMPIFLNSCSFSGCHNMPSDMGELGAPTIFLGSKTVPAANSGVFADIVGVASTELPTMQFVKPGDPANSFLMHKADGDQCLFTATCAALPASLGLPPCGDSMPMGQALIDVSSRDTIRRWIAEGAMNN